MHGVSDGVKLGVAAEGEMADDMLFQASREFFSAFDMWKQFMKVGNGAIPPCENMSRDELRNIQQQWREALARVQSLPAVSRDGLLEKIRVLGSLSYFVDSDDPSFSGFAIDLVHECHLYLIRNISSFEENKSGGSGAHKAFKISPPNFLRRFNLQNFFSSLVG